MVLDANGVDFNLNAATAAVSRETSGIGVEETGGVRYGLEQGQIALCRRSGRSRAGEADHSADALLTRDGFLLRSSDSGDDVGPLTGVEESTGPPSRRAGPRSARRRRVAGVASRGIDIDQRRPPGWRCRAAPAGRRRRARHRRAAAVPAKPGEEEFEAGGEISEPPKVVEADDLADPILGQRGAIGQNKLHMRFERFRGSAAGAAARGMAGRDERRYRDPGHEFAHEVGRAHRRDGIDRELAAAPGSQLPVSSPAEHSRWHRNLTFVSSGLPSRVQSGDQQSA